MNKEDDKFLELCGDMGFWFDNVVGNEELEQRYYNLTQEREQCRQEEYNALAESFINIKQKIQSYKDKTMFALDNQNDKTMFDMIKKDYENLVELRNNIEYNVVDENIYGEDTQTIDHNLDNLELLIDILNIVLQKGEKENENCYE